MRPQTIPATSDILALAAQATRPFTDVRCVRCGKLIVRWQRQGGACIESKCPRCGAVSLHNLST